ncbi:hypothetical protein Cfor_02995 [Coptotermes formosanus]|uniref:Uncharacterized protein n=1 Tax=Coptotermes formosanus TaxID=36987 RepID=A0A6L2PEE6_COPFO|nr:hypothetical protein Cfor_02995 [Coptotermes formosanus]
MTSLPAAKKNNNFNPNYSRLRITVQIPQRCLKPVVHKQRLVRNSPLIHQCRNMSTPQSVSVFRQNSGRHLLRDVDGLPHFPRRTRSGLDSLSGVTFGWNKRLDSLSGITFGNQKRNFDEIDRSGFNGFVKKNFDEIDRSGFDSFVKKNFDEIDRVGFGSFVKRNAPQLLARNYDKDNH